MYCSLVVIPTCNGHHTQDRTDKTPKSREKKKKEEMKFGKRNDQKRNKDSSENGAGLSQG